MFFPILIRIAKYKCKWSSKKTTAIVNVYITTWVNLMLMFSFEQFN